MDIQTLFLLFVGGCTGGLLAGILGVGGGLVFVPIFTSYLIHVAVAEDKVAQIIVANSMFAIFFAGLSGSIKHYLNGHLYIRPVVLCGIIASLASILATFIINHTHWYNKQIFSLIFISIAAYIAYDIFSGKSKAAQNIPEKHHTLGKLSQIGTLGGMLAALSGVGGGIVMVPMLTRMLSMAIKKATAVSLGIITIMAFASSAYSILLKTKTDINIPHTYGLIIFPMVLPVVVGCVICSPFGVVLSKKIPERITRGMFAVFLVLVILNMIYNIWL
jgi:uncharacterized protein